MEKVIRICELTGKKMVIAENLITEQAIEIVKMKSKEDEFGCYRRVVTK